MPYITVRSLLQRIIRQRRINFNLGGIVDGSNSIPIEGEHGYTRNLIKLNRSLEQYFTTITNQAAGSGSYEYEIELYTAADSNLFQGIIGSAHQEGLGSLDIRFNKLSFRSAITISSGIDSLPANVFHKINVKYDNGDVVITLNGTEVINDRAYTITQHRRIGTFDTNNDRDYYFDGYIKDINYISGFTNNKLIKLDETLQNSSDIRFSDGTLVGSMVNGGSAYSEPFTLNTRTTPHVWSNNGGSIVLPVAGTVSTILEGEHGYQRNLIKLNPSLAQLFTVHDNYIRAVGDFEVSVDFCLTSTSINVKAVVANAFNPGDIQNGGFAVGSTSTFVRAGGNGYQEDAVFAANTFYSINIKQVGSTITFKINGQIHSTKSNTGNVYYQTIGDGIKYATQNRFFEGYIKNVHFISGFTVNKFFKLDEDLVVSNAIVDSNGGSAGAMVNGGAAYSERFTLDTGPTPHVYSNDDGSIVLPIANTVGTDPILLEGEHGYQRNLIKLDADLQQYFTFATQEETGDFEIQVDFCETVSESIAGVIGAYIDGNQYHRAGRLYLYQNKLIARKTYNSNSSNNNNDIYAGEFNTLNIKRVGSIVTLTLNNIVVDSWTYNLNTSNPNGYLYNMIGAYSSTNYSLNGYIKDVHLISGFTENKLFKLDETLVGSNAIVDSNGGSAGVMVNGGESYSEEFTLSTITSPHILSNADYSVQIPIVGTVTTLVPTAGALEEGDHGYQRNIIRLNRSLSQYFVFRTQEESGDFEIQVDFCDMSGASISGVMGVVHPDAHSTFQLSGSAYIYQNKVRVRKSYNSHSGDTNANVTLGEFNTLNMKRVGSTVTLKINDNVVESWTYSRNSNSNYGYLYNRIGWYSKSFYSMDGYIKNFHLISGFSENKFFKLDEELTNSNLIFDSNGNSVGSMVNGGANYSENFTLNTSVSPNVYVNDDASITLPIAGT